MKNEEFEIKEEYDFSDGKNIREFKNGKYFLRTEDMEIPIYLNKKILDNLEKLSEKENISISQLINKMTKYYYNFSTQEKASKTHRFVIRDKKSKNPTVQ